MSICQEAYDAADQLISQVRANKGLDYSKYRELIAQQLFDEGMLEGNWDVTTDLGDSILPELRAVQEDEYDQHMDDEENKPDWDSQVAYTVSVPAYIWLV